MRSTAIMAVALVGLMAQGCAPVEPPDLSRLPVATTKQDVGLFLGDPIDNLVRGGTEIALYSYEVASHGFGEAVGDFIFATLYGGVVIFAPFQEDFDILPDIERGYVLVKYDDADRIEWWMEPSEEQVEGVIRIFTLAYDGNPNAQYNLANFLEAIYPPVPDRFLWYCRAAQQGHQTAARILGEFYLSGEYPVQKDMTKAFFWFDFVSSSYEEDLQESSAS